MASHAVNALIRARDEARQMFKAAGSTQGYMADVLNKAFIERSGPTACEILRMHLKAAQEKIRIFPHQKVESLVILTNAPVASVIGLPRSGHGRSADGEIEEISTKHG